MELSERLAGAVWGHLVGDAVGVPYEFRGPSEIGVVQIKSYGSHQQPAGTWSDDGALMLALLDSLLRPLAPGEERFDTTDQAKRFLAWRDDGAYTPDHDGYFDIGNATATALARLREGCPPEEAGGRGERDQGNGSLMRILPLALVERDIDDALLVDHAHRSSAITHGHPGAQAACALYVLVARALLRGTARRDALRWATETLRGIYAARPDADVRLAALDALEAYPKRSGGGFVLDSFWSAWDVVAGAHDYRGAVEAAVRYGHDTDTTACIAGGLAGLRWGVQSIPEEWLVRLRDHPLVEPLVAALVGADLPTGTSEPTIDPVPPGARTSLTHPLYVNWIEPSSLPAGAGWTGRLGMTILPGKHDHGIAGLHWRDLELDVARLRDVEEVETFVLLVEDHELAKTGTSAIADAMAAHEIELIRFPIQDGGVAPDRERYRALVDGVKAHLVRGERVVVTCRGGLGRTGTLVACLLVEAGLDPTVAMALTRSTRKGTIETAAQEAFVTAWTPSGAAGLADALPFTRYEGGGERLLGRPRQGDVTARHGYGPPVFEQCGYTCVYCGLDMAATYEAWLQLSVDHVVPRNSIALGYPADWVEDIANLVTCCRACNEFGNRYVVADPPPPSLAAFFALRDHVFTERRAAIRAAHERERAYYARLTERTEQRAGRGT